MIKQQPFSRMQTTINPMAHAVTVKTNGLDQLDVAIDSRREPSRAVSDAQDAVINYPASASVMELSGLAGDTVRQRRLLTL